MNKMTPELDKRLNTVFTAYYCLDCDGWGTRGQSPSFPEGEHCQACDGTGLLNDGERVRDLQSSVAYAINKYIQDFTEANKPNLKRAM